MSEQLYYFGYGSNLLAERIHIQNPTAVFKEIARLDVSLNIFFTAHIHMWNMYAAI